MATRRRIDFGEIRAKLGKFDERANDAISKVFVFQAARSEAYMKTRAPWTDRTTNARNGLFALPIDEGDHHTLVLSHSVSYGIWLEVRSAGKNGIIVRAWIQGSNEIWRTLSKLFALMEGG